MFAVRSGLFLCSANFEKIKLMESVCLNRSCDDFMMTNVFHDEDLHNTMKAVSSTLELAAL